MHLSDGAILLHSLLLVASLVLLSWWRTALFERLAQILYGQVQVLGAASEYALANVTGKLPPTVILVGISTSQVLQQLFQYLPGFQHFGSEDYEFA